MSKESRSQIASCPKCNKAIYKGNPNPWCMECGERFSEAFLSANPEVYKPIHYTGPKAEGPDFILPPKAPGYALMALAVILIVTPSYWHPNYSMEMTMLKMSPFAFFCFAASLKYLYKSKSDNPPGSPQA